MSYDLMAFEISKAPKDREEFLKWYDKQSEWEEDHNYDDINVSSKKLQNFYKEMIKTFPPNNSDYDWTNEVNENEMKAEIPKEMYIALEGEVLESPNWEEGVPDEVIPILDKLYEALDEE